MSAVGNRRTTKSAMHQTGQRSPGHGSQFGLSATKRKRVASLRGQKVNTRLASIGADLKQGSGGVVKCNLLAGLTRIEPTLDQMSVGPV